MAANIPVTVRLFQRIRVEAAGKVFEIAGVKARALLAFLLLSDRPEIARGELCSVMWPNSEPEKARASLRQTLKRLKKDLGPETQDFIVPTREAVGARSDQVNLENRIIISDLADQTVPDILIENANATELFLADIDGISADLDAWIAVQRRLLRDRITQLLSERIDTRTSQAERLQSAQALLGIDRTNEYAVRTIMEILASSGRQGAALLIYNELYQFLGEEFDIEPSSETVRLNAEIKMGRIRQPRNSAPLNSHPRSVPAAGDVSDRPTIVITPFKTPDGSNPEPIVYAFSRDLLTVLVRFREWNVVDGASAGQNDCAYLVEGIQVVKHADGTDLNIVLKRVSGDQYIWSETLRLDHDHWAKNHSRIAQRFATAIDCNISADRLFQSRKQFPENRTVFDRWVYCQHLNAIWSPDNGMEIQSILESIIKDEPLFAPAHAELAADYNTRHIFFPGVRRNAEFSEKALQHSRIAVQLDPLETRSQRVLAWTYMMRGEHNLADVHFQHALDLNGANPYTMVSSALGYAFSGRKEEALALADAAKQLQPFLPGFLQGYLVGINYTCGRLEEAVQAADNAEGTISNLLGFRAAALWHLGNRDAASETARRFAEIVAPDWVGEDPICLDSMTDWFVDSFPIRDIAVRQQLEEGFRAALGGTDFCQLHTTYIR